MEPITLQAILTQGANPKNHIAITTYGLAGQGDDLSEAKDSAVRLMQGYLFERVKAGYFLPQSNRQLRNSEEILDYFRKDRCLGLSESSVIVKDEGRIVPPDDLLPELRFEFYRLEKSG